MKIKSFGYITLSLVISYLLFCDFSTTPGQSDQSCSQLAGSSYVPTTLESLLCVARDESGTYYAIDKADYTYRCFILKDGSLVRHQVIGSSVFAEKFYFLSLQDSAQILFKNDGHTWSNVFFLRGEKCSQCDSLLNAPLRNHPKEINYFDTGWTSVCRFLESDTQHCRTLVPAFENEIKSFSVTNFPPATFIEYLARQQTDQYLLITRAVYDWKGEVVVHYGAAGQMQKCPVVSFVRASDGGSTFINFKLNGEKLEAFFGVKWTGSTITPGPAFIKMGSDSIPLERLTPHKQLMSNLGFDCQLEVQW